MEDREFLINEKFSFVFKKERNLPVISGDVSRQYIEWVKDKSFYLATMPRSGTHLLKYFFEFYSKLLLDDLDLDKLKYESVVDEAWTSNLNNSFGFKWFLISHNHCPGFSEMCSDEFLSEWKNIKGNSKYDHNHIEYGRIVEKFERILDPSVNENVRIVFVFRNPLDQIISLSRHFENHKTPPLNLNIVKNSWSIDVLVNAYLQTYLSYEYMRKLYPDNIMFVTYENLMESPFNVMKDILKYYSFDLSVGGRMDSFSEILGLVTPESMREIELKMGTTLAGDQKIDAIGESHMRGGKTGSWKTFFSEKILYKIERRFNEFDLTLNQFDGIDFDV